MTVSFESVGWWSSPTRPRMETLGELDLTDMSDLLIMKAMQMFVVNTH